MKLYSGTLSVFGKKAEAAAREKGLHYELVLVPFSLTASYTPKHAEVLRINPKQQVPVLVDGDLEIYDSTQIFEYFEHVQPDPPLWPAEPRRRARARLLEHESDEVFFPNVVQLFPQNRAQVSDDAIAGVQSAIERYYARMDRVLKDEYLAGAFSYADIAFYFAQLMASFVGAPVPARLERLRAWRQRVGEREALAGPTATMLQYLRDQGLSVPA
jgi:glutathione S-transferase